MRRVIVESPYSGWGDTGRAYLEECLRDCLLRGEAPFASHGLYCGPLDDDKPAERALGLAAGAEWARWAEATVVYTDLGISPGMQQAIERAVNVERRKLGGVWSEQR